jgi:hypothetical protein
MKLKILLVSRPAWDNKSGNTYSNFFQEFESVEFAQIYCRDELPDNKFCNKYFRISERQLIKSIISKNYAGSKVIIKKNEVNSDELEIAKREKKIYDFFRNYRFTLLLWLREFIWFTGKWKSPELSSFINNFGPDIIYTEAYDTFYTYRLLNYVRSVAKVPYVIFHCDDQVTFHKFSLSPLFWINRIILRKNVTKSIAQASLNYCIIDEQRDVYQKIFKKEFRILNKCADFNKDYIESEVNNPVRIVFAGNLFHGRWKTLIQLADVIKLINKNDIKVLLDIYTNNKVSKKIFNAIEIHESIKIKGYLPYDQLKEIQKVSDILVHVESFNLKEKLITYLSFSTKIVDFFELGKCILAIGWNESAPIKYLKEKEAAVIVSDLNKLQNTLTRLINNPKMISYYGRKAFDCGKLNHNKEKILSSFKNDLFKISQSYKQ